MKTTHSLPIYICTLGTRWRRDDEKKNENFFPNGKRSAYVTFMTSRYLTLQKQENMAHRKSTVQSNYSCVLHIFHHYRFFPTHGLN